MENGKFRLIIRFDGSDRKKYFHRVEVEENGKLKQKTRSLRMKSQQDWENWDKMVMSPSFGGLTVEC